MSRKIGEKAVYTGLLSESGKGAQVRFQGSAVNPLVQWMRRFRLAIEMCDRQDESSTNEEEASTSTGECTEDLARQKQHCKANSSSLPLPLVLLIPETGASPFGPRGASLYPGRSLQDTS